MNYQSSSTCISECGAPSWACFLLLCLSLLFMISVCRARDYHELLQGKHCGRRKWPKIDNQVYVRVQYWWVRFYHYHNQNLILLIQYETRFCENILDSFLQKASDIWDGNCLFYLILKGLSAENFYWLKSCPFPHWSRGHRWKIWQITKKNRKKLDFSVKL